MVSATVCDRSLHRLSTVRARLDPPQEHPFGSKRTPTEPCPTTKILRTRGGHLAEAGKATALLRRARATTSEKNATLTRTRQSLRERSTASAGMSLTVARGTRERWHSFESRQAPPAFDTVTARDEPVVTSRSFDRELCRRLSYRPQANTGLHKRGGIGNPARTTAELRVNPGREHEAGAVVRFGPCSTFRSILDQ